AIGIALFSARSRLFDIHSAWTGAGPRVRPRPPANAHEHQSGASLSSSLLRRSLGEGRWRRGGHHPIPRKSGRGGRSVPLFAPFPSVETPALKTPPQKPQLRATARKLAQRTRNPTESESIRVNDANFSGGAKGGAEQSQPLKVTSGRLKSPTDALGR